jgi:hypothetical protein
LKLSEKEAAKHIAASIVTANVATAFARCPNECILAPPRWPGPAAACAADPRRRRRLPFKVIFSQSI